MADFLDLIPLVTETIDSIRARMDADANAGLLPTDTGYIDTTEGGAYFDLTQPAALEAERLWDFLGTEVVAAMFAQSAWGTYLDQHAEQLGLVRKEPAAATGQVTFTGTNGTLIATGTQVAQETTDPDEDPITFLTTDSGTITGGEVTLPVRAEVTGPESNLAIGQISLLLTGVDGVLTLTNAAPTSGGADEEDDEALSARVLLEWRSPGAAGNVSDYERWALGFEGVGAVTVTPEWDGPLSVHVVVTDPDRNAVSSEVLAALQAYLDPGDGTKLGKAPVGAVVTVETVTPITVPVAANVHLTSGYSLAGTGGTIAVGAAIVTSIMEYINGLGPGEDVIRAKVESLFFRVAGVEDVTDLTLNGLASNFTILDTQVAATGSGNMTLGTF